MRLTILNQFFPPDLAPTAHLAAALAEHRATLGDEITVISGRASYADPATAAPTGGPATSADRIKVIRVRMPNGGRTSIPARVTGYLVFTLNAWLRVLTLPRQDVIIALTTPPYAFVPALVHKLLHRRTRVILWSMDVYPDAAERFGQLDPQGPVARLLRWLNRRLYPRLDHLVCLDEPMRDLLVGQYGRRGAPPASVIPNWEADDVPPVSPAAGAWSGYAEPDLRDRFVVAYTGNTGTGHRFDAVLGAAGRLDPETVAFLFVGGGVRWDELRAARTVLEAGHGAPLVLHGYVDRPVVPSMLAGASAALITLDDRSLGLMSPSKLHGYLAAGRPVLYVGPQDSNVDEAIRRFDCGFSLRNGDIDGLVKAIESLRDDPELCVRLSANARRAFEEAYCASVTLPCFDRVIEGGPSR